jgi:hypothetical protein
MLSDLLYRLRALFRGNEMDAEVDDELRYHLEREAEKYRCSGISSEDAARRARLAFGGRTRWSSSAATRAAPNSSRIFCRIFATRSDPSQRPRVFHH